MLSHGALGLYWLSKNYQIIKSTSRITEKICSHWTRSTGCEVGNQKFHHYFYGQKFSLETDQRPLVSILSKSLLEASLRMQWLLMKTVPYDMTVKYIPGTTNTVADCLSTVPLRTDTIQLPILQVHQITNHLRCTADWFQQLHEKTAQEDTLALLKHSVHSGWPEKIQELSVELLPYWTFCKELTIEDGLVFKNNRIEIPSSEHDNILKQIHHGHLGIQNVSSEQGKLSTGQESPMLLKT